jgi:hypothetical protein
MEMSIDIHLRNSKKGSFNGEKGNAFSFGKASGANGISHLRQ